MKRLKKLFKKLTLQRTTVLIIVFLILSGILVQRIFSLQIIHGQEYADNFTIQTTRTRTLKSTRGNIRDRNGNILASNQLSYSVTLEDNGDYDSTRKKNLSLNGEIYKIIQIIENHGDSINHDFHVVLDEGNNYIYDAEGFTLSRFKADVYGKSSIDDMTSKEANASAETLIHDLMLRFGLELEKDEKPYSEKELREAGLPTELTKEETLKIITVRYALFTVSFRKYVPVTIATDVCEETVADILENQKNLQGVDIAEDSIRVYTESEYFAPLLGYTGKISSEELAELRTENPDGEYSTTSIVGKSGLEKIMESTLQGKDGSEKVYVDSMGKVLEIDEKHTKEPTQGNDVYLTIDRDLQIACYKILEQKIAGIVAANIQNIKSFEVDDNTDASDPRLTIASVNNGSPYLRDEEKVAQFGVRVAAQVWDDVTVPSNLKSKGQSFLQNQKTALVQYQIDAVDLAPLKLTIDSFKCGWWYETYNPLMGIDEELRVVGLSINLNDPTASTLSIGDKILSQEQYNKTLKQQAQSAQQLKGSVNQQSRKIATIQSTLSETEKNLSKLQEAVSSYSSEVQNQITSLIEELQIVINEVQNIAAKIPSTETIEELKNAVQGLNIFVETQKNVNLKQAEINADIETRVKALEESGGEG